MPWLVSKPWPDRCGNKRCRYSNHRIYCISLFAVFCNSAFLLRKYSLNTKNWVNKYSISAFVEFQLRWYGIVATRNIKSCLFWCNWRWQDYLPNINRQSNTISGRSIQYHSRWVRWGGQGMQWHYAGFGVCGLFPAGHFVHRGVCDIVADHQTGGEKHNLGLLSVELWPRRISLAVGARSHWLHDALRGLCHSVGYLHFGD